MKSRFILLFTLSISVSAYSMNLSWLDKLKPVASRAASVVYNCGSVLAKGSSFVGSCVKEYKTMIVGLTVWLTILMMYKSFDGEPTLYAAIQAGNTIAVRLLCLAGANKEAIDYYGRTPLHFAVIKGKTKIVCILVQAGANTEAVDRSGYTPLFFAAMEGNSEMVRILVQAGANKDAVGRNACTPLHFAVCKGNPEIVNILVRAGANKEAIDRDGNTPLLRAVRGGSSEIVRTLVQAGANTEAVGGYGYTPLHLAVISGNTEIVRILAQAGANKEAVDGYGYTPLRRAVIDGNTEIVRTLAQVGANIEAVNIIGYTALHYAVERGNAEIVRILVQAGANTVAVDGNGRTLRALAQAEHRHKIIGYLDSLPQKEEQMHAAAQAGNVGKVQELVAQGAPVLPGIVAAIGEYNLQAPSREHGEIARLLLDVMGMRQAARAKCADGRTLLHVAAACGNTKFAEALARYGADVNAVDVIGNTPLHLAKSAEMNEILLQHGARVDAMNAAGQVSFSTQIGQWQPYFRKWVEEDKKIPDMFVLKSDSAS